MKQNRIKQKPQQIQGGTRWLFQNNHCTWYGRKSLRKPGMSQARIGTRSLLLSVNKGLEWKLLVAQGQILTKQQCACKYQAFCTAQRRPANHFAKHRWSPIMFERAISGIQRGKSCWDLEFLGSGHTLPSVRSSLLYHDWFPEPFGSRNCEYSYSYPTMFLLQWSLSIQTLGDMQDRLLHSLHTHHNTKSAFADQWESPASPEEVTQPSLLNCSQNHRIFWVWRDSQRSSSPALTEINPQPWHYIHHALTNC